VHKRPTFMRFAAAATVLALAAPVWATEIQMKKKEDPKQSEDGKLVKKKNCPIDTGFNTLEDLFGLVGPIDPLALQSLPQQQAAQVALPAAGQPPATPAVEWRDVSPANEAEKQQPQPQPQPPQPQQKPKQKN